MTAETAPALGWSITANLDGNSQLVLQSFVAADAPESEVNAILDKATKIIRRQKAPFELDALKKEKLELGQQMNASADGVEQVQNAHNKRQAQLDIQILELNEHKAGIRSEAEAQAHQRGQSVKSAMAGNRQALTEAADRGIKAAQEAKAANENELQQAMAGLEDRRGRLIARQAELDEMIAEKEALLG